MKERRIWKPLLLLVCVVTIAFLSGQAISNPNWRARASLLAHGHIFVELASPGDSKHAEEPPNQFVSKMVYKKGLLIGYIDRYGDFVSKSDFNIDMAREHAVVIGLYGVQVICWGIVIFVIGRHVQRNRNRLAKPSASAS